MGNIYRKQRIEGVTIPAVIHNSSYFLIQLGVYEDGTVSCWEKTDLGDFISILKKGWVTPQVPDGKELSINGLGAFRVESAKWQFDITGFNRHIEETVRSINPEMRNIYVTSQRERDKWDKARVRFSASPVPFKLKPGLGYTMLDGKSGYIFYRNKDGGLYITELTVYADKTARLGMIGDKAYTAEEIGLLFDSGVLLTAPAGKEEVTVEGLGKIVLADIGSRVEAKEKKKEINELALGLAGEADAIERCRKAHYLYLSSPSDQTREYLRKAYDAVPEHNRIFLGDMDTRDSDFRRILFCPDEKREV